MSTWSQDPPSNLWCHTEQKRVLGDSLKSCFLGQFMGFYRTYNKKVAKICSLVILTYAFLHMLWGDPFLLTFICSCHSCYLAVTLHFEDHSAMAGFLTDLVHSGSITFYGWYVGPRVLSGWTHGTGWSSVGRNCTFSHSLFRCVICRWNSYNLGRFFLPLGQTPSYLHTQSEQLPATVSAQEEEITESWF